MSPSKRLPRIPMTPHRPSTDIFWDQEAINDWNMEHSPHKLMHGARPSSPVKSTIPPASSRKENKREFQNTKHSLAEKFLGQLDDAITAGKLKELAASTGGIRIIWSPKLNTTAGRANWKRETLRTGNSSEETTKHRHHASIELAEKVIDNEHRLLNVIAHEFCHLANFMVSGVTNNPHGREFKAWAAKCSRAFGHRGIEVTTKHSYDIAFKYVWECKACGAEYKRHSKSINLEKHRCGSCKGELAQIKPVPRRAAARTEYQEFMKENMRIVKQENPDSPQKEIMKVVAEKWSKKQELAKATDLRTPIDDIAAGIVDLTLEA
jgi:predicted SprT family Zn-dependent metalloprotease